MQEDTEAFNENSNSEVIILPQNSHLDETLISDDDEIESETPHSYDAKLNAKLKDLGLYEDGMTIQQKEELLAVVAVSFKTAEEEKTRRQWYEEYANAALSFPEDEIEFSFQESPELELSTKGSYSGNYSNAVKSKGNSVSEIDRKIASTSSSIVSEDGPCLTQNPNEFENLPSTSSQSTDFKSKSRRSRVRGSSSYKLLLEEGNTVTSHSTLDGLNCKENQLSNKQKKHLFEKRMSLWKPCLSPKDEPLICSRRQLPEESDESNPPSEEEEQQRMLDHLQDFNFALLEIKKSRKKSCLSKPYHLSRSGHCLRKSSKLDSLDIMVGVQEGRDETSHESGTSSCQTTAKKEPFSRTSGGAFRYAQLHRERIDALRNASTANSHTSCITTRSGARYGFQRIALHSSAGDECRTPEILIEDGLDTADISLPDRFDSSEPHHMDTSEMHGDGEKLLSDAKLPKFSNLRPDLCVDGFSGKEALGGHYSDSSTVNRVETSVKSLGSSFRKENHIDSSSQDGELSDSSSVIDVETIDDEIEELVLKRKLLQESTISDKQTYSNRPKRLKKNAS